MPRHCFCPPFPDKPEASRAAQLPVPGSSLCTHSLLLLCSSLLPPPQCISQLASSLVSASKLTRVSKFENGNLSVALSCSKAFTGSLLMGENSSNRHWKPCPWGLWNWFLFSFPALLPPPTNYNGLVGVLWGVPIAPWASSITTHITTTACIPGLSSPRKGPDSPLQPSPRHPVGAHQIPVSD